MEEIPGLPLDHFDKSLSIYALGWTVNLQKSLTNIYRSLKPDEVLVLSWEHPIHSVVEYTEDELKFRCSYVKEGIEKHESWRNTPIVMHNRKASTILNYKKPQTLKLLN
ncbi:hypothetical protein GCM10010911_50520 [Paenibacillus nasutitermitis]|uniref:Methyltransferase type 11 domain-containing protein n=2 Tax=Paenibacillus nasutitermitis TaxID=1652958 RepID=A0A917DZ14_9BACL|nr:hypothetical protein GCM10010911_50520 [Paenibacillus nasutitermitis]